MKNKFAFITGSTQGIGKQIGLDLLSQGYFVYFNGHTEQSCIKLGIELKNKKNFKILKCDLSDINYIEWINQKISKLDVLILNVGRTDRTPFGQISPYEWDKVFDTNLKIPFFLVQKLKNKIRPNGKIIFISSIAGCTTDSTSISYGVSKGAIHVLVPYLAKEFANQRITVNAVCPTYTDTNWHLKKSKAQLKRIAKKHLFNRLCTTKEVSKAVLSIIDNNFINGHILRVDGGFGIA